MKRDAALNHIYGIARSPVLDSGVAVTGHAYRRGRSISERSFIAATLTGAALFASLAQAALTGGQVSAGTGTIAQAGTATTITQQSQNLAINWNTFSIATNESVRFNQPNASSIALNRILGSDPSQIFGSLSANGQVFILNPNGVLFGRGAQVNVGGLVASTLKLNDADFMAGNYHFANGGMAGTVVNQGTLTVADGGYIALLAPEVRNEGVIIATLGTALLAAGDKVTLNLNNGSLLGYSIDKGSFNALAENQQLIQADGGQVIMSAKAANALSTAVVNNTGIIEARTVQNIGGVIKLMGDMQVGQVNVGGTLDASAPAGGDGGFVETSAAHVQVANTARVTTVAANGNRGTWLIDPVDFTIAASGGDMTGAALSTSLGATNVTILSSSGASGANGDIFVNDAINWAGTSSLTLNAIRNVDVNAAISNTGTGNLVLRADMSGSGSGAIVFGAGGNVALSGGGRADLYYNPVTYADAATKSDNLSNPYAANMGATPFTAWMLVNNVTNLQSMNTNLAGNYALGMDINAAVTSTWNPNGLGGYFGFAPVGNNSTATTASQFTGAFDGLGHTISNLVINRPSTSYVGLFGYIAPGSIVRNVGSVGGSVSGSADVGGLAGYNSGNISNAYVTGNVSGSNNVVGGLAGYNSGNISNSYTTGNVSGNASASFYVGGLIGTNYGSLNSDYATGTVSGNSYVGGLVGINLGASVSNSYATGSVSGSNIIGGLVGQNDINTIITNSYATGNASGTTDIGGLAGINYGAIITSYATGNANGSAYDGGLVGYNTGTISISYAAGSVTGSSNVGGLVGYNTNTSTSNCFCFWNTQTSGQASGIGSGQSMVGITGLTTAQMKTMSSFAGWSIANTGGAGQVWRVFEGGSYPLLTSFLKPLLTVTAGNASKTYDGAAYSGGNGVTYSDANAASNIGGSIVYGGTSQGALNASGYTITASGLYSRQQGYDTINYVNGALTINPATVTVAANADSKTYDGLAYSGGNGYTSSGYFGADTAATILSGTVSYGGASQGAINAGSYAITPGSLNSTSGNYTISYVNGALTVNTAPLTITANDVSKTYGQTLTFAGTEFTSAGLQNGEIIGSATLVSTGTAASASVANNPYSISVSAATGGTFNAANYTIYYANGALTVNPAPLTITANNAAKIYGQTIIFTGTEFTHSALQNGETMGSVSLTSPGAASTANVTGSPYAITASAATGGTFDPANYSITYVPGALTVNQAPLTVTANNNGKVFNDTEPNLYTTGVNYSGFVNGETSAVLGGSLTLARTGVGAAPPVQNDPAGNYNINASGLTSGNYAITYAPGSFTISPAGQLLIVMANSSAVYGVDPASLTFAPVYAKYSSGGVITDLLANPGTTNTGNTWTLSDGAGDGASFTAGTNYALGGNVGNYSIGTGVVTPTTGINFSSIATTAGVLSITPRPVTVTAPTKVYDGTNVLAMTSSTIDISNRVGSDIVNIAGSGSTYSDPNVGTSIGYTFGTLALTGAAAGNYSLVGLPAGGANGVITPAALTVTANAASKTYNGLAYSGGNGVAYSGLVNNETSAVLGGTLGYSGTSQGATNVGNYVITPSGLTSGNYTISYVNGTLTVNPATVTVAANADSRTYNGLAYSGGNGYTANGFFGADTAATILSGTVTYGGTSQGAINAGGYAITPGGLASTSGNYTISYADGTLTVNPAALTIIANSAAKTYGQTINFAGTEFWNSALQNGETMGTVTLTSAGAAATANVAGGPYTITASAATGGTFNAANYNINYVNSVLSVNPAPLTVTANNATKITGQTLVFAGTEFTPAGLQNGETIGSVSLASAGATTAASVTGSPYAITASAATGGTFDPANYNISYVDGQLTISQASQVATALGGTTLVLAYNAAQQGISNVEVKDSINQSNISGKLFTIVNCGVLMPPDVPANNCQN